MAKMTRAKARKRLLEAQAKFQKVYMWKNARWDLSGIAVNTKDMEAVEKIVARCVKRLK
jgi:hypothetical protein